MVIDIKKLRNLNPKQVLINKKITLLPLYFILENVYDTYNIGAFFRLADGVGVSKIYLCGSTEYPPHPKISKSGRGLDKVVFWEYFEKSLKVIKLLRKNNNTPPINIIAVEQHQDAIPYTKAKYAFPLAFIFGNETTGIKKDTLKLADQIIEIPMFGKNKSLNVLSAASIAAYQVLNYNKKL